MIKHPIRSFLILTLAMLAVVIGTIGPHGKKPVSGANFLSADMPSARAQSACWSNICFSLIGGATNSGNFTFGDVTSATYAVSDYHGDPGFNLAGITITCSTNGQSSGVLSLDTFKVTFYDEYNKWCAAMSVHAGTLWYQVNGTWYPTDYYIQPYTKGSDTYWALGDCNGNCPPPGMIQWYYTTYTCMIEGPIRRAEVSPAEEQFLQDVERALRVDREGARQYLRDGIIR